MPLSDKTYVVFNVILVCILEFNNPLFSQQPNLNQYTINNGLPSQTVYCINQDQNGFLWFGTDAGVSKFDGHSFENYTILDGLSDNEILNIHGDSKGRLWFFTLNGSICYFKNNTFYNSTNDSRLAIGKTKFEAISFLEDSDGSIWIGSNSSQLFYFNEVLGSRLYNLDTLKDVFNGTKNWVFTYIPKPGIILVRYGYHVSRLYKFQNEKFILYNDQSLIEPLSNQFYLQNTGEHTAYFKGRTGICRITKGTSTTVIPSQKIPNYHIDNRFFIDKNNDIWTTNLDKKVHQFTKLNGTYQLSQSYSLNETIGSVFIDLEGNKWFTTTGAGVYKMSASSEYLRIYNSLLKDGDSNIEYVKKDKFGNIWYSSNSGNLYQIKNDVVRMHSLRTTKNGHSIKIFEIDSTGNIYCITREGLFVLINAHSTAAKFINLPANTDGTNYNFRAAKNVKVDHQNNLYFTSGTGLLRLNNSQFNYFIDYVPYNSLISHRIYCLYFDILNNIWFENYSILCSYNGQLVKTYEIFDGEIPSQISGIEGTVDSILIISTYGNGVIFFRDGKVINKLTEADGLAGNLCRHVSIEEDTIYIATNQGFSYFTYKNNKISNLKTYTVSEGLPTGDAKSICAYLGKVYIATSSGLCVLDKNIAKMKKVIPPPKTYFKSISINGSRQRSISHVASYQDDITIEYTAITFDQPEKVRYQYNLTDDESSWIETKNHTAILSSLKPGDYVFRIRAKKYNSTWSNPIHLQLQITPPIWQEWYFMGIVLAFFIILGYYVIKWITGRKYQLHLQQAKAQQALAEERYRISSDMHDDLGADLSNILLLMRMANNSRPHEDESMKQLTEVEYFTKNLINKVNEIIWAVNPVHDSMQNLFEYINDYCMKLIEHNFIKGSVDILKPLNTIIITSTFRRSIFLVIKEVLNNIVKHSGATSFELRLKVERTQLVLRISDNGKGFAELPSNTRGNGLLNIYKRIKQLGGTIEINSSAGKGVAYNIYVPLTQTN